MNALAKTFLALAIGALVPLSMSQKDREPEEETLLVTDQDTEERNGENNFHGMDCASDLVKFDPLIHKKKYRVAVHASSGFEEAFAEYNLTYTEYLTETAGKRFDPPIEFEMVPVTYQGLFDAVEQEEVDFFYANPSTYSCVGVELGAQPLVTIIKQLDVRGHTYDLDVFGGVIFTRADNDQITSILDLKDKIIGAGAISMLMAGQMQIYEMGRAGLSYVMDPKQVVFTGNQLEVVNGVLSGEFDVGFVRTEKIERAKDAYGNPLDPDNFKIIEPKIFVLDNGNLFPFLHSTDIYPEWPVAALTNVPPEVSEEVQQALEALADHADMGQRMENCRAPECTMESLSPTRCDTTPSLASLAWQATKFGHLSGFRTARSYFEVRTMQEAAGFIKKDEKGEWKCTRAQSLYEGISCPEGHYKIPESLFSHSCQDSGLQCKEGHECFCRPCIKANEVDLFEYEERFAHSANVSTAFEDHDRCEKMSLCGSVEQTKEITIMAYDNKKREGADVSAIIHFGTTSTTLDVRPSDTGEEFLYEFHWSENHLGVGVVEVFVDGEQIPTSPVRIQVVPRDCELDFPGEGKKPAGDGHCACGHGSLEVNGKCLSSTVVSIVIASSVLLLAFVIGYFYIRYKNKKNDEMWQIEIDELQFDEPMEVVGQGSFGVVVLADYRGTRVAIKRAHKMKKNRGSSLGASSRRRNRFGSSGPARSKGNSNSQGVSTKSVRQDPLGADSKHSVDSFDVESQIGSEDLSTDDMLQTQSGILSTENFSIGFLAETYGRKTIWTKLFPWLKKNDYRSRIHESILGQSASMSKTSTIAAMFCSCMSKNASRREEFVQEMRVLSRLRHPCITTVMGAVVSNTLEPMLVMEYLEYGSLHDLLRNDTMHLNGEFILQVCRDISQGLRFLHSSRPPIMHGDLKARNILIDSRFRAKLCDFGLSSKKEKSITGTPYWLAPEYLRGQSPYNTRCDMYSVGIILFELYARTNPYEGENFREVLRKICDKRVNKRPTIPKCTPQRVADLMKKLWSPDPNFRPQAQDMDTTFMDMNAQDLEPVEVNGTEGAGSKRTTGDMLYELFPRHVADALKAGKKVEAESHDLVTVVFSDIIGFTDISREISPLKVSQMLDRLYLAFDKIAGKHGVFKVETIGDAYMGVTNLEGNQNDSHVKRVAAFAVDMVNEASKIIIDEDDPVRGYVNIRVGFHSGPVVSNVIGSLNPRYGLFGDTVNTANRMESNSKSNRILCSERAYRLLKEQDPEFPTSRRGKIHVKGKGEMLVYWIGRRRITASSKSPKAPGKHVEFDVDPSCHDASTTRHGDPAQPIVEIKPEGPPPECSPASVLS